MADTMDVRMRDGTIVRGVPVGTTRAQLEARLAKASAPKINRGRIGFMDKADAVLRGGFDTLSSGTADEITAGLYAPIGATVDAVRGRGFDLGRAYDRQLGRERATDRYDEQNAPVARGVGQVAGAVALPGAALSNSTRLGIRLGVNGLQGAAYGFGSGEGGFENRARSAAKTGLATAVGGEVGRVAVKGLGRVIAPAAARVRANPALADQYPHAADVVRLQNEGVPLTPGMVAGGLARDFEEGVSSVPVLGSLIRRGQQNSVVGLNRAAANRALAPLGETLPPGQTGQDAFGYVQEAFDRAYDRARAGLVFEPDAPFAQNVTNLLDDARNSPLMSGDTVRRLEAQATRIGERIQTAGGRIGGDDLKPIISDIKKAARQLQSGQNNAENQALGEYLERMARELDGAAARNPNSAPEAVALMRQADKGYGDLVILQDAARRRGGDVSTATTRQLDAAVQKADGSARNNRYLAGNARMQDLTTPAMRVLPENMPNSGTPERAMFAGLLGGGAMINPQAAGAAGLLSLPYLPVADRATEALLTRRPGLMTQFGLQGSQIATPLGSGLGLMGATQFIGN